MAGQIKGKVIHTQKEAAIKDAITTVMVEEKRRQQGEQLMVLDALRKSRAARGGVGAPLAIPAHLRPGTDIIVTDADMKLPESREEAEDSLADIDSEDEGG